jgi:hypothetical protein
VFYITVNLTLSPIDNEQHFALFKLENLKVWKAHSYLQYILNPQSPQPKPFTCFYAD